MHHLHPFPNTENSVDRALTLGKLFSMKSRSLNLIEVAIVMVLAAILIGTLFYTQTDTLKTQTKVDKVRAIVLERERFFMRLNQILNSDTVFHVEDKALLLKYDNGVDYERAFCGPVSSLLYQEDRKIYLATWPKEGEGRIEVLLEDVEDFSFTFFDDEKNNWSKSIPNNGFTMLKIIAKKVEYPFFL